MAVDLAQEQPTSGSAFVGLRLARARRLPSRGSWIRRYATVRAWTLQRFRVLLTAHANIVFSADRRVGAWLLAAICIVPQRGLQSVLATLVSQAIWVGLGRRRDPGSGGFAACGAVLTALCFPGGSWLALVGWTMLGAAVSTALTLVIGDIALKFGVPPLALPFLVATTLLTASAATFDVSGSVLPGHAVGAGVGTTVLEAFGALVLCPMPVVGAVVALACLLASRFMTLLAALGATMAIALTRWLGLGDESSSLVAGYNALLTCCCLGAALPLPNPKTVLLGLVGAALATLLTVGTAPWFQTLGLPVLAWPFVISTHLLGRSAELLGVSWYRHMPYPLLSAERNVELLDTLRTRLGAAGPTFRLPVSGHWAVTQGVDGSITHRGPWRFALDLEILDAEGFPFQQPGHELHSYYCYCAPVLAPGYGTVVAVHDGQPDMEPGQEDRERPWGNAVVLCHDYGLYSVLAHLQPGSVEVALGQAVVPGQRIARCGASGRSPRPHLHFQVQATPVLGGHTLEFSLLDYLAVDTQRPGPWLVRRGVPTETTRVWGVPDDGSTPVLPPPVLEVASFRDGRGRMHELRPGVLPTGERYLQDGRTHERLFYVPVRSGLVFTSLEGTASGLLGSLLMVAPALPSARLGSLTMTEFLPGRLLRSPWTRPLDDVLGPLGKTAPTLEVELHVHNVDGRVTVRSEARSSGSDATGATRYSGELAFDSRGITYLRRYDRRGRLVAEYHKVFAGC